MKKTILMAVLMGSMLSAPAAAKTTGKTGPKANDSAVLRVAPTDNFATITFDTLKIDLGKFPASKPERSCTFYFTNTGTAPLVIHQALASCGCTVPTFSKEPVKPGEKGRIEVSYNGKGKFPGVFQKTVTVRSNATNEVVRLVIMGEMTEN